MSAAKAPRATAARGEAADSRQIKYLGVALELPAKLPGSFSFDYAELQECIEADEDASAILRRILKDVLGPEQLTKIRDAAPPVESIGDAFTVLFKLLGAIVAEYGVDTGE